MARGRILLNSLGHSRKFRELAAASRKLGEFAQTLFCLIVASTDDFGRLEADPFTVKCKVFPSSPRSEEEFNEALRLLHNVRLIILYEHEGDRFLQVEKFEEAQTGLHKRTKSKFPSPGNSGKFPEIPSETKRTEQETKRTGNEQEEVPAAPEVAVFDYWREAMDTPKSLLTVKREKAIKARLAEGYTVEDLTAAIDGCKVTPHNMGQNDRGEVYNDIELICRDGPHVERFRRNSANPPMPAGANGNGKPKESVTEQRLRERAERHRREDAEARDDTGQSTALSRFTRSH